ncbi:MAG TPA: hypothetical protein ENI63_01310 [Candidatus Kaiserbacteria bacterium]|nr:hypothetical protein [Candidatus Kaiserbacteria bacterium]
MKKKSERQIVYERAWKYAKDNFCEILVIVGEYDSGQRCQHISRQLLEKNNEALVVVTLSFVPKSGVNVHFINNVDGKYIDNTLGYLSKKNTYFLISQHSLSDIKCVDMNKMLVKKKEKMLNILFTKDEITELGIKISHI